MGSWNVTCLLSNLPILPEEAVKCVLLYYKDGFYKPTLLPITGVYNDYGTFKPSSTEDNLIAHINKTSQKEFEVELTKLFNGSEKGKLSLCMIHKDIWEVAINTVSESTFPGSKKNLYTHYNDLFLSSNEDLIEANKQESTSFKRLLYNLIKARLDNDTDWIYPEYQSKFKHNFLEMQLMNSFMQLTRRAWKPQTHYGSQATNIYLHLNFNQFLLEFTKYKQIQPTSI